MNGVKKCVGAGPSRPALFVERLALGMAWAGGGALLLVALITLVSILGRALIPFGLKPLRGEFELVQAGTAFVVCAFLPWAHLKRGHASVAVLSDHFPPFINRLIDLLVDVLMLAMAILLTWRLGAGMLDKLSYGETTFLLRMPLWWAYAICLPGLGAWSIVALWASLDSGAALFRPAPVRLHAMLDGGARSSATNRADREEENP